MASRDGATQGRLEVGYPDAVDLPTARADDRDGVSSWQWEICWERETGGGVNLQLQTRAVAEAGSLTTWQKTEDRHVMVNVRLMGRTRISFHFHVFGFSWSISLWRWRYFFVVCGKVATTIGVWLVSSSAVHTYLYYFPLSLSLSRCVHGARRRTLENHQRSDHIWFYSDVSLAPVSPKPDTSSQSSNNVSDAASKTTVTVYTLSQLIKRLNDTDVNILRAPLQPLLVCSCTVA